MRKIRSLLENEIKSDQRDLQKIADCGQASNCAQVNHGLAKHNRSLPRNRINSLTKRKLGHGDSGFRHANAMQNSNLNQIAVWRPSELDYLELRRGTNVKWPYPRHWHEEIQICLVDHGSGELKYRGETYVTPTGSLFIVAPGEIHENRAYGKRGCSFRTIYFPSALLDQASHEFFGVQTDAHFDRPLIDDPVLSRLFVELHVSLEKTNSTLYRESILWEFMARLLKHQSVKQSDVTSTGRKREAVESVRSFLLQHYNDNVPLSKLAQMSGLSPYYLCHIFNEEIGMPPHAFQNQVRVIRAKTLLQQGVPISQVAYQMGFADQSHFSRHFKRLMAMPPGKYARNCQRS